MDDKDEFIYMGICPDARKLFDLILAENSKINKNLHFATLANFCEACIRLKNLYEATRKANLVVKSKNGETYVHPVQKLIKDERDEICRCAAKLGLDINAVETTAMGRPLKGFKAKLMAKVATSK